jgi:hypothetical protein
MKNQITTFSVTAKLGLFKFKPISIVIFEKEVLHFDQLRNRSLQEGVKNLERKIFEKSYFVVNYNNI